MASLGGITYTWFGARTVPSSTSLRVHGGLSGQEPSQHALVIRDEMLDKDQRHTGVDRQAPQQFCERLQAAGRRADSNHWEAWGLRARPGLNCVTFRSETF
jgi:hypothetical protein